MPKIPIVVKVWAGDEAHDFEYISRSLPSLLASELPATSEIVVFDDCSTDKRLLPFLKTLADKDKRVRIIQNEVNKGPNWGQVDAFNRIEAEYPDAPYYVNVDDDVIYHKKWLIKVQKAREELGRFGLNGIFTALNIPMRPSFATLSTSSGRYLLKWKQPALNWIIPREIYQCVGKFRDEGIAYDTGYLHRLRLNGFSVICLSPSYVQNIGVIGAYARDKFTTANDFCGEGYSLFHKLIEKITFNFFRFKYFLQESRFQGARIVAPIRWGFDVIYEALRGKDDMVAIYLLSDQVKKGWTLDYLTKRTNEILTVQPRSPFSIRRLHKTLSGKSVAVEGMWRPSPNLHEYLELTQKYPPIEPQKLFLDIFSDLAHFHQHRVVHNKIRRDNVYYDSNEDAWKLAWFGSEYSQNLKFSNISNEHLVELTNGLDKNARPHVRERFLCRYLEAIAPELLHGAPPSLHSDVFSAAAVAVFSLSNAKIKSLQKLKERREALAKGNFVEIQHKMGKKLYQVLSTCLEWNPSKRFKNATEVLNALKCCGMS